MNAKQASQWQAIREAGAALPFPPGHYYSCIPDLAHLHAHAHEVFRSDQDDLPGIDLRPQGQLDLLSQLAKLSHPAYPRQAHPDFRYFYDNDYFGPGEATILSRMMLHCQPRRIVEVGSGFSSAVMLDMRDKLLTHRPQLTFIEPYPDRLKSLLRADEDRSDRIIESGVQDVGLDVFEQLRANDILFIDSSHVVRTASDVNHLFFNVLPRLQRGVWVHIHDIYWPFEYPASWVYDGKWWTEAYLLRAFLQFNHAFQIELYPQHLVYRHHDQVRRIMPDLLGHAGSSFWMRRL